MDLYQLLKDLEMQQSATRGKSNIAGKGALARYLANERAATRARNTQYQLQDKQLGISQQNADTSKAAQAETSKNNAAMLNYYASRDAYARALEEWKTNKTLETQIALAEATNELKGAEIEANIANAAASRATQEKISGESLKSNEKIAGERLTQAEQESLRNYGLSMDKYNADKSAQDFQNTLGWAVPATTLLTALGLKKDDAAYDPKKGWVTNPNESLFGKTWSGLKKAITGNGAQADAVSPTQETGGQTYSNTGEELNLNNAEDARDRFMTSLYNSPQAETDVTVPGETYSYGTEVWDPNMYNNWLDQMNVGPQSFESSSYVPGEAASFNYTPTSANDTAWNWMYTPVDSGVGGFNSQDVSVGDQGYYDTFVQGNPGETDLVPDIDPYDYWNNQYV